MNEWMEELEELETADEFLDYFHIPYDLARVQAVRLPLLARFRENLNQLKLEGLNQEGIFYAYKRALFEAWSHFAEPGSRPQFQLKSSCGSCNSGGCNPANSDIFNKSAC